MTITPQFPPQDEADKGLSSLARGVVGSEILRIASEIRALKAKGAAICNLTVGDFDPAFFPIPDALLDGTRDALAQGHTNYPPSDGVLQLREDPGDEPRAHVGRAQELPVAGACAPRGRGVLALEDARHDGPLGRPAILSEGLLERFDE